MRTTKPKPKLSSREKRLRQKIAQLTQRLSLIRNAIPPYGSESMNGDGEQTHNYTRVSETTIQNVERYLNLRKSLTRLQMSWWLR